MGSVTHLSLVATEVAAGRRAVLATVVRADRSTPRRHGASMVVFANGQRQGTVGGGEMESRVVEAALEALIDGKPRLLTYRLVDPAAGDPGVCGGEMDVYVEPYMNEPNLVVIGAGHVGRSVVELAQWSGWHAVVWDDRVDQLTEFHDDVTVLSGPLSTAIESVQIDSRSAIVLVTRNVELDRRILPEVLATSAGYIGLMGSARRWATTRQLLLDDGLTESDLERICTPIGIDIGAETPVEIAISIMAEVLRTLVGR